MLLLSSTWFPLPGELESVHDTLPQLVPQPRGHHSPLPPLTELQTLLGPRPEVCQHRDHRRDTQGDRQAGPTARVSHLCLPAATAAGPQSARRAGEDTVWTVDVTATEHGIQHPQGETGLCSSGCLGALQQIQRQVSSVISTYSTYYNTPIVKQTKVNGNILKQIYIVQSCAYKCIKLLHMAL